MSFYTNCKFNNLPTLISLVFTHIILALWVSTVVYADVVVPVEVAKTAAADMLPRFYPGEWHYYTHFVYFDIEGQPAAYAIVFSTAEAKDRKLPEIRASMTAAREKISSMSSRISGIVRTERKSWREKSCEIQDLRQRIRVAERDLNGTGRFATVVTGAVDTQAVVLKCYKGLPRPFVQEADAKAALLSQRPGEKFHIGKIIYLSRFDFLYEFIREDSERGTEATPKSSLPDFSEDNRLFFNFRTSALIRENELRQKLEGRRARQPQQIEATRTKNNKKRWEQYIRRLHKSTSEEIVSESQEVWQDPEWEVPESVPAPTNQVDSVVPETESERLQTAE